MARMWTLYLSAYTLLCWSQCQGVKFFVECYDCTSNGWSDCYGSSKRCSPTKNAFYCYRFYDQNGAKQEKGCVTEKELNSWLFEPPTGTRECMDTRNGSTVCFCLNNVPPCPQEIHAPKKDLDVNVISTTTPVGVIEPWTKPLARLGFASTLAPAAKEVGEEIRLGSDGFSQKTSTDKITVTAASVISSRRRLKTTTRGWKKQTPVIKVQKIIREKENSNCAGCDNVSAITLIGVISLVISCDIFGCRM